MLSAITESTWQLFLRPEIAVPLGAFVVGAIAVIAQAWRRIETHKADVELKRDMIARGMSAEEIERVLSAKSPHAAARSAE